MRDSHRWYPSFYLAEYIERLAMCVTVVIGRTAAHPWTHGVTPERIMGGADKGTTSGSSWVGASRTIMAYRLRSSVFFRNQWQGKTLNAMVSAKGFSSANLNDWPLRMTEGMIAQIFKTSQSSVAHSLEKDLWCKEKCDVLALTRQMYHEPFFAKVYGKVPSWLNRARKKRPLVW